MLRFSCFIILQKSEKRFLFASILSILVLLSLTSTPVSYLSLSLQIFVDDVLVFRGSLLRSPSALEIQNKATHDDAYIRFDENQLPWGDSEHLNLSQSILFSNDETIVQREVTTPFINFLLSLFDACSSFSFVFPFVLWPSMRSLKIGESCSSFPLYQLITSLLAFYLQESRVPLPENDLCFFDDGKVKEETVSLDLRGCLIRPMTASRRG